MTETTIAMGGESADVIRRKAAFSYCCECGTYDAHTIRCTCCGFDFRVGEAIEDEGGERLPGSARDPRRGPPAGLAPARETR